MKNLFDTIQKLKQQESLKDHCGVFGIYARDLDVAKTTYIGLHSLQHRGQESAGIVVSDGEKLRGIRQLGLVTSVFNEQNLLKLKGFIAVGHNRYSTTGGNTIKNVQPVIIPGQGDFFAVSHNGNLVNAVNLAKKLDGVKRISTSDTEIVALRIKLAAGATWEEKILNTAPEFMGAYSIVACSRDRLYAFRDPWGFRPLVLGNLHGNIVVASESCALDTVGATYIRDLFPGEIVSIGHKSIRSVGMIDKKQKKFCLFEYVYLARPDSILNNVLVHEVRQKSGALLAREAPVKADLVVAVPDSGTSAALGFSKESGIPFGEVLIKNRYIGRTFIAPDQAMREHGVRMKFNPMKQIAKGKRIVIVDDSIVRGTTMKKIVEILKISGAKEIHLRICSPPIHWPCFFGVDTPERKQLIASSKTIAQIKKFIGANSLHYLSLEGLIKASQQDKNTLCTACFNGKYPMAVDLDFKKNVFENTC